jgi:phosphate transport system substrate-binding protein
MVVARCLGVGALVASMATLAACGDSTNNSSGAAATAQVATPTAVATCATGSISADGSSAIKALIQKAADEYQAKCPGATITVAATNSSTGVTKAAAGTVDIGDSDIPATLVQGVDAGTIVDHPVAIVLFDVVVNSGAGVTGLTLAQIRSIFSGQTTNWSQVGGANLPITVLERTAGSGTRFTFDKDIMQGTNETSSPAGIVNTTATLVTQMGQSSSTGAITYLTASSVTSGSGLVPLSIDGTAPSSSAVASGSYPFFSHEHCFTKAQPSLLALSFLQYIQSAAFQNGSLTTLHYIPLSATTRLAAVDH